MKKIIVFVSLVFIFAMPVCAQDSYGTNYQNIVGERLDDSLDESTKDFFEQNGIDAKNPDWVNNLTGGNVINHIWQFVTGGIKAPVKAGILIAGIIFVTAAITSFGSDARFETAIYAATLSVGAIIAGNVWQSVAAAVNAIKACSSFMLAFIPVFASVVAVSGKTITAAAMSALLLAATEAVSYVSSFTVLPLMGGYLALSISSGVSPLLNNSGLIENIKKASMWIISLLGTLFVGILGIQTAVNSAADNVALRTAKFILGTSVPVAGSVLGEAVSTISASVGLLRSSIGIYGVVALAFMVIPIVIELILWRLILMLNISLGELFSLPKTTGILKAVDSMLSLLLGVVIMVGAMFIISLTVVVTAGKG